MRAMVLVMTDPLFLQVGTYEKRVDLSELRPLLPVEHFEAYIRHHKALKSKAESSLYTEVKMMRYLFMFLEMKEIERLRDFSYLSMQELYAYLSTVSTKQNRPLSKSSQRLVYTFFKSFALWLNEYYPTEAPSLNIFQQSPYRGNNDHLKTTYFSDHILKQIRSALHVENDIYMKCYILIALYYGLRSIDIVTLTSDCLQISDKDGKYDLHYRDHKQDEAVTIPAIAAPVARAIALLIRESADLRQETSHSEIFIYKGQKGVIRTFKSYQRARLDRFAKRHQIKDEDGDLITMSSHMFRRTLATNLQSSGAPLESTQRLLNHKSKRTTLKHYIKIKQSDYIDQISKTLEHMQVVASSRDVLSIRENEMGHTEALRLSDGYCTNNAMATQPEYMCDQIKLRGNCYGCSKMVTTPEFLPYFRTLIKEKEQELVSERHYGEHLVQQISFERDLLKELVAKLEVM